MIVFVKSIFQKMNIESRGVVYLMTQFLSKVVALIVEKGLNAEVVLIGGFRESGLGNPSEEEFAIWTRSLVVWRKVG